MTRGFTSAAAIAAMLLTSAAPPPDLHVAPTPPEAASPVKCRIAPPPPVYTPPPPPRPLTKAELKQQRREDRKAEREARRNPPPPPPPVMAPPPPMAYAPPPPPPAMAMPSASRLTMGFGGVRQGSLTAAVPADTARYDGRAVANILSVAVAPVSTFSVDVDTGSYANVRRFLNQGQLPPSDAVRTEELINYFRYGYARPTTRAQPFSVTTDVARTPWNPQSRLLRIGLRGYDTTAAERPPANLVFLVDVSGSMSPPERLPLVKTALTMLADKLTPRDRVSIVVYAGAAGIVLEPTSNKDYVKAALECLNAGGSTAGGAGLKLAYATARAAYIPNGINRILVATDGDFNVGTTNNRSLEDMVKAEREGGISLTTLGFGTSNYNEALMERIADVGNGNYAYIDNAMEARKVLDEQLESTLFTIARDVKIQVEFNPAVVGEYRLIGYENRALAEEDFANDAVDAGDIGAGHQVTALYEVMPRGSSWLGARRYAAPAKLPAARGSELAFVKLRYKLPGEAQSRLIERPVAGRLLQTAAAPTGDMAFVTAVAAFGQRLRGDKYLGTFSLADVRRLAGSQSGYIRSEFGELVALADSRTPKLPTGGQ